MLTCCDVVETGLVWSGWRVETSLMVRDHFSKMETLLLGPGPPGPAENTRIVCGERTGGTEPYLDG